MIKYLVLALLLALAGNAWQLRSAMHARENLGQTKQQLEQALGAAKECSNAVDQLQLQADKRAKEAAAAIAAARKQAADHKRRADAHLATPPAVPGDDAGSARSRIQTWWSER